MGDVTAFARNWQSCTEVLPGGEAKQVSHRGLQRAEKEELRGWFWEKRSTRDGETLNISLEQIAAEVNEQAHRQS